MAEADLAAGYALLREAMAVATPSLTAEAHAVESAAALSCAVQAVHAFRRAAEAGLPAAQVALAESYLSGWGDLKPNEAEGHRWMQRAAESGSAAARGFILKWGIGGGVVDADAAIAHLQRAAEADGDPAGMVWYADCLREAEQSEPADDDDLNCSSASGRLSAMDWARRAADAGHPGGLLFLADYSKHESDTPRALVLRVANTGDPYALARMAETGNAANREFAKGVSSRSHELSAEAQGWLLRAADRGCADLVDEQADRWHGLHPTWGPHVCSYASMWYRRAAEAGRVDAMYWLGMCLAAGPGADTNYVEAFEWFRRAADAGNVESMTSLAACYRNGRGVAPDPVQAAKWFAAAADRGDAEGAFRLGQCHFVGAGLPRDLHNALRLFRVAATQDHGAACTMLGRCYLNGWGIAVDATEGGQWLDRAARAGDAYALACRGTVNSPAMNRKAGTPSIQTAATLHSDPAAMVRYGTELRQREPQRAFVWFQYAADAGDPDGLVNMGSCYEHGSGIPTDTAAARDCYAKAAAYGDVVAKSRLAAMDRTRSVADPGSQRQTSALPHAPSHEIGAAGPGESFTGEALPKTPKRQRADEGQF